MHDDLVRLWQMDTHDRKAARANQAARSLKASRREREQGLADAEAQLAQVEAEAQDLRKRELTAQRELEQARTFQARARQALEQGLGDADAAQRQLERTTEQIDELETQLLEYLEAADALGDRRQAAVAAIDKAREHLTEVVGRFDTELKAHQAEAAAEANQVRAIAEQVPADVRGRYTDFRAKGQWAVAVIRDGACNACNNVVAQQHVSDLRRGLLKPCLGCHRFLVMPDAEG